MKLLPLILLAVCANSIGSAFLSQAMKQISEIADFSNPLVIILTVISNANFLIGLVLLITFFLLFLTLLSKADLSYVLPVTSFNYVITVAIAAVALGETVSMERWLAVLLISTGVLLVSRGESSTVKS